MSTVTIYGIRSCSNCRAAIKWLSTHGITHEYKDIRDDGLSDKLLNDLQNKTNWEDLLNKRSITWRRIPDVDRTNLTPDTARQLILNYPTILKRPVLDLGDRLILGFDETRYRRLLSEA